METAKCIEVIYGVLVARMSKDEASQAVSDIVGNKITDLADKDELTSENLEKAMNEEASFYIKAGALTNK